MFYTIERIDSHSEIENIKYMKGGSQMQTEEEYEEARLNGLNQGIRQEKVSTVLTMHGLAFSTETIALVTRLSTEEIEAIILENWS